MAILSSCCCWRSVRRGSFVSGFYTLIYYSILVIGGTFQVESNKVLPRNDTVATSSVGQIGAPLSFTIVVVVCAGTTVFTSIVLLVGLCVDNRLFLLPWIGSVSANTFVCSVYSVYLIATVSFMPILAAIFTLDFFISILNVYCLLCVISQYQEYKAGRGRAEDVAGLHQENGRPSGGPCHKKGSHYLDARTLLVNDQPSSQHNLRSRIHFQESAEPSSTTDYKGSGLQVSVCRDSPSTDTSSSRLQSETSTTFSSPSRQKRVQFSNDVVQAKNSTDHGCNDITNSDQKQQRDKTISNGVALPKEGAAVEQVTTSIKPEQVNASDSISPDHTTKNPEETESNNKTLSGTNDMSPLLETQTENK